jgi:hypothetical protein
MGHDRSGLKNEAYPEHVALPRAARRLGRSVPLQATRSEDRAADAAGQDTLLHPRTASGRDRPPTTLDVPRLVAFGAYAKRRAAAPAINGLGLLAGPYASRPGMCKCEAYLSTLRRRSLSRCGTAGVGDGLRGRVGCRRNNVGEDPVRLRARVLPPPASQNAQASGSAMRTRLACSRLRQPDDGHYRAVSACAKSDSA